jgi:hypothetical protein
MPPHVSCSAAGEKPSGRFAIGAHPSPKQANERMASNAIFLPAWVSNFYPSFVIKKTLSFLHLK